MGDTKNKTQWIFPSRIAKAGSVKRVNNAHDEILKGAAKDGIKFNFVIYDFRHTFATRMAQNGIDLATLAAILGHNSLRILERYVTPTDEHKRAAMDRYDQTLVANQQRKAASERQQ